MKKDFMTGGFGLDSEKIRVEDSIDKVYGLFYELGWTDGFPVVPPTKERIKAMLSGCNRDPRETVAVLPPKLAAATIEKIAINAVMAGSLPDFMPVIISAVEAVAEEKFRLMGVQTTTHPCGVLIVVNGPISRRLGINSGSNAFGPGVRSNATIGRTLSLILLNIGGGIPGQIDKSTQGNPCKYTYCTAENEAASPWQPFHAERGFRPEDSTVTVFAAEGPHNINDHDSTTGSGILKTAAATMATAGNNNLIFFAGEPVLMLGPEHAATLARDGFTKEQIKDFIFENARVPLKAVSEEHIQYRKKSVERYGAFIDSEMIPLARREDIIVMVVGGSGKHSCFIPTFGLSYSVTKKIDV
jgi:hypothetical protein